ncbi:putative odorant-binding protein A5 [Eurytemora carolleeae]|uniref:putative odorant-binding protein A5 n=1 Tax=Eurytemora carolleeae TaxID=1294199 RepID=UPI000C782385|nr:putative odorant-binding protein A5 [Eurytemora carolleeae]|eukprot:XP_023345333.1 putative odorant-binding protein A5 [Eurytemora affinis]
MKTGLVFVFVLVGAVSGFRGNFRDYYRQKCSKESWDNIWRSTGTVPNKLSQVPDVPLYMETASGTKIFPNQTLDTAQLLNRPSFKWNADPNALYTLLIEDNDIELGSIKYAHLLVTNIPGSNVYGGDEVIEYIPSFTVNIRDNEKLETRVNITNRHLVLVYKQPGRINFDKKQSGCNPEIFSNRIIDHDALQQQYGLQGPVAGNFYRIGYSSGNTEYYICYLSACTGRPLPVLLSGINDKPLSEC